MCPTQHDVAVREAGLQEMLVQLQQVAAQAEAEAGQLRAQAAEHATALTHLRAENAGESHFAVAATPVRSSRDVRHVFEKRQ